MEFIYVGLGFLLYIAVGLGKTKRKHQDGFSYKKYFKDESSTIVVAAISATILVLLMPSIGSVIMPQYANFVDLAGVVIGYFNYSLIRGVLDTAFPKKFVKQDIKPKQVSK